jgi:hypothetical protein
VAILTFAQQERLKAEALVQTVLVEPTLGTVAAMVVMPKITPVVDMAQVVEPVAILAMAAMVQRTIPVEQTLDRLDQAAEVGAADQGVLVVWAVPAEVCKFLERVVAAQVVRLGAVVEVQAAQEVAAPVGRRGLQV